MDLVTLNALFADAGGEYAIPAVNCYNLEMIQAVLEAAEEMRSPIIVQSGAKDVAYSSPEMIAAMTLATARNKRVRFAIHLDHGNGYALAEQCIQAGYTSVMFDGSTLDFRENLETTKRVVELAHAAGVSCEAELGTIGDRDESGEKIANAYMTDPAAADEFVQATGVDCLAVGVGNAHGFYPLPPNLDLERLEKIESLTQIPLVLHGGSGLPEAQIKAAIKLGITKINYSTAARMKMIAHTAAYLRENQENPKSDQMHKAGREGFKQAVYEVIRLCGSDDKH